MKGYQKPKVGLERYNCPHCHAFAHQEWLSAHLLKCDSIPDYENIDPVRNILMEGEDDNGIDADEKYKALSKPYLSDWTTKTAYTKLEFVYFSHCSSCEEVAIWVHNRLFYPNSEIEFFPNADMPPDVAADFSEAAEIVTASPRAAAALLRLAVQKLMKHLGLPGKRINDDIGALVQQGLPVQIQQALDIVRVIGNNAVHPGEISVNDNLGVATQLFGLVNFITDRMITHPKAIKAMFDELPQNALNGIKDRDK